MIPDFAGKVIEIARIDRALFFWTADNWEIRLAGPVLVGRGTEPPQELEVDTPATTLPPVLDGVVGATVSQLLVTKAGDLVLQLGDRHVVMRADPEYEAWQIGGHDGELLICTPGGELAYFPPVSGSSAP